MTRNLEPLQITVPTRRGLSPLHGWWIGCLLTMLGTASGCHDTSPPAGPASTPESPATATADASANNEAVVAKEVDTASAVDIASKPPAQAEPVPAEPRVSIPLTGRKTWEEMDDPHRDGWHTEALSAEALKQLKSLGKLIAHPEQISNVAVSSLISDGFSSQALLPEDKQVAFDDSIYHVVRKPQGGVTAPSDSDSHQGSAGMTAAIESLAGAFANAEDVATKFKIFRITLDDGGFTTHQYVAITGSNKHGRVESHATWIIRWLKHSDLAAPRIDWIGVDEFELTTTNHTDGKLLVDCAASILGGTTAYEEQLRRGLNYWIGRTQQTRYAYILGTPGIAVGDVNGDGLDDLYLCQPEGIPNRLFLQQPDGTVTESSAAWGVDWTNDSRGVLLFDWDNDGDQDLAVAILGGVAFAINDGNQRFRFATLHPTDDDTMSLAAADYDQDGDLDLYTCVYSTPQSGTEPATGVPGASANFVYHDANDGARNTFLQNNGQGTFIDVTEAVGLDVNNHRFSLSAAWEDYDNDGDLDLYVANDYGRDNLFENRSGQFTDVAESAQVENSASGMAITWGDFDRNGFMDAYVSNMFSSAGNRITFQQQFKGESSPEVKQRLQRFARGNTLLKNRGDASFKDVSRPAGVEMGRWAWGSHFVDLNNDGWQDLVVANGYVTDGDNGDL